MGRGDRSLAIVMRLRFKELNKIIQTRCGGPILPDDDAGIEYLEELLWQFDGRTHEQYRSLVERMAPWFPKDQTEHLISHINGTPLKDRMSQGYRIGRRLRVTMAEYLKHGLQQIRPDMPEEEFRAYQKERARSRARARRAAKGAVTREDYLSNNPTSQRKPWLAEGISRRTWYRHQDAAEGMAQVRASSNGTGPCASIYIISNIYQRTHLCHTSLHTMHSHNPVHVPIPRVIHRKEDR